MAPRKSRLALLGAVVLVGYAGTRGKLRRYEIAEDSMEPSLRSGDYVIAQARSGEVQRGDIVVFGNSAAPGLELVKRVIGLPGEAIDLSNGHVHINGVVLAEPWADRPTRPDHTLQLADDECFVLGDNRSRSAADSRELGPIRESDLGWVVVARYWPPQAIGRVNAFPR